MRTFFLRISFLSTLFTIHGVVYGEIALFYAMEEDLTGLKKVGSEVGTPKPIHGRAITSLDIGNHRVRAVKMDSGSVSSAIAAMALFGRFPCDLAISVGPAGSLRDEFSIGDWVRIVEVVAFQEGAQNPTGFSLGKNACRRLTSLPANGTPLPLPWADSKAGRLASGSIFSGSGAFRDRLRQETNADLIDMNLAGLEAACAAARVPLICWKIVSDAANDSASSDFAKFCSSYKGEGGELAAQWIQGLPPNPQTVSAHPNLQKLLEEAAIEDD